MTRKEILSELKNKGIEITDPEIETDELERILISISGPPIEEYEENDPEECTCSCNSDDCPDCDNLPPESENVLLDSDITPEEPTVFQLKGDGYEIHYVMQYSHEEAELPLFFSDFFNAGKNFPNASILTLPQVDVFAIYTGDIEKVKNKIMELL